MRTNQAIEFLVKIAEIDIRKLVNEGQPSNVADLGHIAGLCYELCRFNQTARSFYERLVKAATQNPRGLDEQLKPLRQLIASIADREDYSFDLEAGSQIRIFAPRLERDAYIPLPFVFWTKRFAQGLVITAVIYLGHSRDVALIRRCVDSNCRKLFLAARRSRAFCSHECASKASMRAYQERQRSDSRKSRSASNGTEAKRG